MKKRLLSVLLMCCMVLGLLPTVAFAEETHSHCICGGENSVDDHTAHTAVTWTGISDLSEITAAGNYFLRNDVTLSDTWRCEINGVKLCLNGKTITGAKDREVILAGLSSTKLEITDCRETVGKITHKNGEDGLGIAAMSSSTVTLWNGRITGNIGDNGGVLSEGGAVFIMNGGSIDNNTGLEAGGVYVFAGLFYMNGGSITGNRSTNFGGGVSLPHGYFTMTGGSITQNTADRGGGGVYISFNPHISGDVNISGNVSGGILENGVLTGGTPSNVWLRDSHTLPVESGKPLADTARIGITAANPASSPTVVTGTTDTTVFFSDNADYMLVDNGSNGLKLTDALVTVSGVKLLNETGGTEMTGGKTYDGKAVAYDDSDVSYTPNVSGVSLTYAWQKLNGETYGDLTDAPKAAGSYRLLVSAVKNGYTLGTQELAFTISPKEQTAPAKPELDSRTKNSITLKEIPANDNGARAQYRVNDGDWQDSPVFTGLSSGTEYSFTACYAETDSYAASPASEAAMFRTDSGGGGGVSAYTVTVKDSKNGTVTADRRTASYGNTVTLTVSPNQGWTLETITATAASGKEIDLTIVKVGEKYTFTMPSGNVTVTSTFMEDNTILNYFVDVPTDSYYYEAVLWAVEQGITQGTDDSHFSPGGVCTRAQAVTFLWRAAGSPAPKSTTMPFTDVPAGSYYYDAVLWAVENGITKGTSATEFSPNESCSRAQIVTFLYRSEQVRGNGMDGAWMFQNPFTDVDAESYYGEAVMWAIANNVTEGTSSTTFSPDANCTRAQIVTFLWRCMK